MKQSRKLHESFERANAEAELEKQRVADEVKQQIISVAAVMASKFCLQKQWMIRKMML